MLLWAKAKAEAYADVYMQVFIPFRGRSGAERNSSKRAAKENKKKNITNHHMSLFHSIQFPFDWSISSSSSGSMKMCLWQYSICVYVGFYFLFYSQLLLEHTILFRIVLLLFFFEWNSNSNNRLSNGMLSHERDELLNGSTHDSPYDAAFLAQYICSLCKNLLQICFFLLAFETLQMP